IQQAVQATAAAIPLERFSQTAALHRRRDVREGPPALASARRAAAFLPTPAKAAAAWRKCARKMSEFPLRRDKFLLGFSRVAYARRNSWPLFSRCRRLPMAHYLFIPARVIALCEFQRNVTANHRTKRSALREYAHINVNQEVRNREQRRHRMQKHGKIP